MIQCDNLHIKAGKFELQDISFTIPKSSYYCLMGQTGSGKTTILEAICGLRTIKSGQIFLNGNNITHCKPASRGIGFVPQDNALFSTMTVKQQLGFSLKIRKWNKKAQKARIEELSELLGITHILSRTPFGLSGGEKQRVALGRALSFRPEILCLDEPFSALDDKTKEEIYHLIRTIHNTGTVTILHISHSFDEAKRLADGVIYIEEGKLSHYLKSEYKKLQDYFRYPSVL